MDAPLDRGRLPGHLVAVLSFPGSANRRLEIGPVGFEVFVGLALKRSSHLRTLECGVVKELHRVS